MLLRRAVAVTPRILIAAALLAGMSSRRASPLSARPRRAALVPSPRILFVAVTALLAGAAGAQKSAPLGAGVWNPGQQGRLLAGGVATFTVELRGGLDYIVHGSCDEDCDLVVRDPDGAEVGSDDEVDSVPVVELTTERTGRFQVEVSCPFADCTWEIRTEESRIGSLAAGEGATFPIRLRAGTQYRVTGLCDDDCTDLDLRLRNPRGEQVDEDTLPDAYPVLLFRPEEDGEFTLVVEMFECSVEPCIFSVLASLADSN